MASTHTTNLGLNKPDRQDFVSVVNDINDNMDTIDTAVGNLDTDKVNVSDIVDNLTTNDSTKPLSAAQGYALNNKIPTGNAYDTIQIPAGSDLNNYRTPGTFIVPNDSVASQISNMPYSASGRLIVMNRTTSSYIVQEYYTTSSAPTKCVRNYNNGTWTDWEWIALKSDISVIKTDYFTGTTSASGNISKAHASKVIVLSAWTSGSDIIVAPFPGSGAGLTGQYTWWFHLFYDTASHSVIANTSVTIYYTYIEME